MYITTTNTRLSVFLITKNLWRKKCQKNLLIRTILARKLHLNICAKLVDFIKITVQNPDFIARHKQNKTDFTRKRSLPFFTVVTFLLNLLRSSLQNELDKFFHAFSNADVPKRKVTASALCQARKKLKHEAFIELNQVGTQYFYDHFNAKRWHGMRLLVVDGSMTQVPKNEETEAYFGSWHPASGGSCPMARLSQMFDVLNNITVDASIAPCKTGEKALAAEHIEHISPADLVLFDRGYAAFWLFQLILRKKANFCARLPTDVWTKVVGDFLETDLKEQIIDLEPSFEAKKACEELGLPTTPIKVRLLRIDFDNDEFEVLITSLLDTKCFPYKLFKDLYHKRWPVEEQYELLKSRIEIGNFTGKSVLAIKQDFYARVFMSNLTAMLAFPIHDQIAEKHKDAKLVYKINWTQALAKMKISGMLLFFRKHPIRIIKKLHELFLKTISAVRPGRKYPRKPKIIRKSYAFAYKPIA